MDTTVGAYRGAFDQARARLGRSLRRSTRAMDRDLLGTRSVLNGRLERRAVHSRTVLAPPPAFVQMLEDRDQCRRDLRRDVVAPNQPLRPSMYFAVAEEVRPSLDPRRIQNAARIDVRVHQLVADHGGNRFGLPRVDETLLNSDDVAARREHSGGTHDPDIHGRREAL